MRRSTRRLPHWDVVGEPLFVTFRLHGSLPANRDFPPAVMATAGKAFVTMDRVLDRAAIGPSYLRMAEIAGLVVAALQAGGGGFQRERLAPYVGLAQQPNRN